MPGAQDAIAAPIGNLGTVDPFDRTPAQVAPPEVPWEGPFGRLWLTMFTALGATALALPVAGIYMHTRRLRFDPSLVQTIIVLPIVVAGVVLVVKNSLALAFALAGIVAGVRFRQKLNEPKDAVSCIHSDCGRWTAMRANILGVLPSNVPSSAASAHARNVK